MTALRAFASVPVDAASLGLLALMVLLTLLVLLVHKAVAANVVPQRPRLSRTLDVAVVPFGMGALALGAAQLANLLTESS